MLNTSDEFKGLASEKLGELGIIALLIEGTALEAVLKESAALYEAMYAELGDEWRLKKLTQALNIMASDNSYIDKVYMFNIWARSKEEQLKPVFDLVNSYKEESHHLFERLLTIDDKSEFDATLATYNSIKQAMEALSVGEERTLGIEGIIKACPWALTDPNSELYDLKPQLIKFGYLEA